MKLIAFILSIFSLPLWAQQSPSPIASPIPSPGDVVIDPSNVFQAIISNIGANGSKMVLASAIVLLLVWAFRQFVMPKLNLGTGVLPWISLVSGALVGILSNVVAGVKPADAANIALISGVGASHFWASVLKLFQTKDS